EVEPWDARNGKVVRSGITFTRNAVDLRAAGIAEPEEPRSLVERFPRRVVERRPKEAGFFAAILHVEEQRMATAREQAEEWWLDWVGLEVERGNVALQMIDRRQRQPSGPRNRLGSSDADVQSTDQPRPRCHTEEL